MQEKKTHPEHADAFIMRPDHTDDIPWQAMLAPTQQGQALASVQLIAERLQNSEQVLSIVEQARQQSHMFQWGSALFSNSFASIAHFYLYLARCQTESRWEEYAHHYLRLAAQSTQQQPLQTPGLYDGTSGFGLILSAFCMDEPRYQQTSQSIQTATAQLALEKRWKRRTLGVDANDYDVISGVAGIVGYLVSLSSPTVQTEEAILKLIGYLIWLSAEDHPGYKNWFVTPELFPMESYREEYPDGYFNLGLSHGIPGPLAALAVAWKAGYRIPGQREAIESLSQWIVARQIKDEWGINWPAALPLKMASTPELWQQVAPARTAWCYGVPGIAAALWLAGDALQDTSFHQVAQQALETAISRVEHQHDMLSPTICHGTDRTNPGNG